ncbi:TPA: hypothetical protein SLE31_004599 [Citrobacter freundii]|nr:hypothetical protein [Citrobacter freundii]
MSPDTQALVDAIDSLRHSSSVIKNYIWPLIPAVITSTIGFYIASYNFKSQEILRADVKKIENVNKFLIQMDSAFQSLVSVKTSIIGRISDDPIQRIFGAGVLEHYFSDVNGVEDLVFLAKGNSMKNGQPYYKSWNNIPRINAMVGNYKYLVQRIMSRNKIKSDFEKHLDIDEKGKASMVYADLSSEAIITLRKLVNENEIVLNLLDGLIVEFNSFLSGINAAVSKSLNIEKIKHLTILIDFDNSNSIIQESLQPLPLPNYATLAKLFDVSVADAMDMYKTGYF